LLSNLPFRQFESTLLAPRDVRVRLEVKDLRRGLHFEVFVLENHQLGKKQKILALYEANLED
jgi:hypothetical protein